MERQKLRKIILEGTILGKYSPYSAKCVHRTISKREYDWHEVVIPRRLVKLNPQTGDYAEIDSVRLKREAKALLDYVGTNISRTDDPLRIWQFAVPLCEGVLDEILSLPIKFEVLPLKRAKREGLLPKQLSELYSSFSLTISGTAREISENIEIGGEVYTYADFEDEGGHL